eukprot:CCRYP_008020-RA/>CCRYP_008020-RA protein AED:0.09 eAED:0.09 QI:238/0.66/0.75/1/1/1/4/98/305
MKFASIVSTAVLAGLASVVEALSFAFEFDNTADSTVTPPIVGTGTFSFDSDPGPGTFALTSLPNFNFLFNFGSQPLSNADISTPLANILVRITGVGSDYSVNFGGSGGGLYGGSLDFVHSSNGDGLTFQPNFGLLYGSVGTIVTFGTFQGLTPSSSSTSSPSKSPSVSPSVGPSKSPSVPPSSSPTSSPSKSPSTSPSKVRSLAIMVCGFVVSDGLQVFNGSMGTDISEPRSNSCSDYGSLEVTQPRSNSCPHYCTHELTQPRSNSCPDCSSHQSSNGQSYKQPYVFAFFESYQESNELSDHLTK